MNDSKIKVLLVEPEKYPKEIVIDDSLDDLFLNTIGGLLGYLVYKGLIDLWKRYEKAKNNVNK